MEFKLRVQLCVHFVEVMKKEVEAGGGGGSLPSTPTIEPLMLEETLR